MDITIRELLDSYGLNIELPSYLYDEKISPIFLEANLIYNEHCCKISKGDAVSTITPNNPDELIRISYGPNKRSGRIYAKDYISIS